MKTIEQIEKDLEELRSSLRSQSQPKESKVHTISNFLDETIINQILQKFEDSKNQNAFKINHWGFWGEGLATGSFGPVYMLPLYEFAPEIEQRVWRALPQFKGYYPYSLFLHIWQPGSQINWHNDVHDSKWEEFTTTIYLNKNWNENWGGLFLYKESSDDTTGTWVHPTYNQLNWFVPPVWHATTMCATTMTEPRLSIQGFWRKSEEPILRQDSKKNSAY